MKKIFTILLSLVFSVGLFGQISYNGCSNLITGPSPYTLSMTGTTSDDGTIRNSYAAPPVSCSAGACHFTMTWNIGAQRWELSLPGVGVLHYNTSPSAPNPPDLTLGTWVNEQACSDITTLSGDVQSSVVLPVELHSFSVKVVLGSIHLRWQTASEIDNEKFEIEESQNGRAFQTIGGIKGIGTTFEQQNYSFEVTNPRSGITYYRLKQIDFDGQFEYSKVISVNYIGERVKLGEFYPNPSRSGTVNLDYNTQSNGEILFSAFDVTGKLVVNQIRKVTNGDNNLSFNISHLNTGVYILKIVVENNLIHRKLIIER